MKKAWLLLLPLFICCTKLKKPVSDQHEIKVGNMILKANIMRNTKTFLSENLNVVIDKNNEEVVYFKVRMDRPGTERITKEKSLYIDFDIQENFVLLSEKDSLQAGFCQRIQNGVPDSYEYIVAFDTSNTKVQQPYTLIYKDQVFGIGTIAFVF